MDLQRALFYSGFAVTVTIHYASSPWLLPALSVLSCLMVIALVILGEEIKLSSYCSVILFLFALLPLLLFLSANIPHASLFLNTYLILFR